MKKNIINKISIFALVVILLGSFLFKTSLSRADDDEGGDRGEDYRPPVQTPQPQPEILPQPQPIIIQPQIQIQQPSLQTPAPAAAAPALSATAPKTNPSIITKQTIIKTVDNSALLASLKDSDKDGIPDIMDKHPGQDDFAYSLIDNNHNGIADDLEILLK